MSVKEFIGNAVRLLRMTKKPEKDEFFFVAKITGLGILLIGLIGYIFETVRFLFGL